MRKTGFLNPFLPCNSQRQLLSHLCPKQEASEEGVWALGSQMQRSRGSTPATRLWVGPLRALSLPEGLDWTP